MFHINGLFLESYWKSIHNRRQFLVEFATQKGFDPLVPENWGDVSYKEIKREVYEKNNKQLNI